MSVYALSSVSAALIMLFLGAFILVREPRSSLHRVYFFFCLIVATVGFLEFELRTAADAAEAFRWVKASSFWTLAPAAFFHFAFLYTRRKRARRSGWVVPLVYLVALSGSFLYFKTDLLVRGVQKETWGWTASATEGLFADSVFAAISLIGLVPIYLCVHHLQRLENPAERRRAKIVTLGYVMPVLFFILTEIIGPGLKLDLPEATTMGCVLGALVIWFGIWRFKLFVLSPWTAAENIVSMMADALLLVGTDGAVRLANQAALRLLGYSEPEIIGMPIDALLSEEGGASGGEKASLDKMKTGPAGEIETSLVGKDGQTICVSLSQSAVTDSQGVPQGVVLVIRDLTERKSTEEELRRLRDNLEELVEKRTRELDKKASELRAVLDALPDLNFRTDDRGIVLDYHAGNPAELAAPPGQFMGKRAQEFLPPPVILLFEQALRRVLETKSLYTAEFSMPMPGGDAVFESRVVPLLDNQIFILLRNITQAKAAARALAESEERYRSLFENSTIGMYRTALDGRILMANPTLIRMLGFESFEDLAQGHPEEDGLAATHPRALFKERIEKDGAIHGLETDWKKKDGTTIYVRESATAIRDAGGNALYYEGTVEDITDRRKAEDALRASLHEKEALLREVHHRVKNNMQIISSLLSLQAREVADPAVVRMFRDSQSRIRSMAFVHEKLYQSKDLSRIGFSDYIQSLLDHLSRTFAIDAKRIKIETAIENVAFDIDTAIPCGLIINELVTNAFKHAFPRARKGKIRLDLLRPDGSRFMLRVADNGVGFPKGLDFRTTESLGMQLVMVLVEQINGRIEREAGPGTAFRIEFGEVKYQT